MSETTNGDWTPDRVRDHLTALGLSDTSTDEEIEQATDELLAEIPSAALVTALQEEAPAVPEPVKESGIPTLPMPDHLKGKPCRCLDPNCTIPYGICHCGCGQPTGPYASTDSRMHRKKGEAALCLPRHQNKIHTGESALPFLQELRRKARSEFAAAHGRPTPKDGRARGHGVALGPITLSMLTSLYDTFVEHANGNKTNLSVNAAVSLHPEKYGNYTSTYGAHLLWRTLVDLGCTKANGPAIKILIRRPAEKDWQGQGATAPAPVKAEVAKPEPSKPNHVDALETVTDQDMAAALANAMWMRYEWVLSELGKARENLAAAEEAITVRDQEIARLQSLLEPPNSIQLAHRILGDTAN